MQIPKNGHLENYAMAVLWIIAGANNEALGKREDNLCSQKVGH
jgi:hypothetical protein